MVVKLLMEPRLEQIFHPRSFGYRPGRSALQAVAQARRNSWRFDWVIDLDIKGLFDTIRCWPTSFCTTCSMSGCASTIVMRRSSGMPMMSFAMAVARRTPERF